MILRLTQLVVHLLSVVFCQRSTNSRTLLPDPSPLLTHTPNHPTTITAGRRKTAAPQQQQLCSCPGLALPQAMLLVVLVLVECIASSLGL